MILWGLILWCVKPLLLMSEDQIITTLFTILALFLNYFITAFSPVFHMEVWLQYLLVWTVCIPLTTPFSLGHPFITITSCVLCIRKQKKKCFYKIWGGIRVNNINQGPKIFSYEKNACAEVRRHSDIYFRCSGGFWFMSKFLVVFCSRSCHGSSSRISETLLYPIQKVLFVLFFIKVLEVRVKESETNQIPRGRLHLNQVLSILF